MAWGVSLPVPLRNREQVFQEKSELKKVRCCTIRKTISHLREMQSWNNRWNRFVRD